MPEKGSFYVRMDMQIEAKNGQQILEILNNFIGNLKGDNVGINLLGIGMGLQRESILGQSDMSIIKLPTVPSQGETQGNEAVFERIFDALKSDSKFVLGMETSTKLIRCFPDITKENLFYWEKKGYIHPNTVQRGAKKGRVFPTEDVFRVAHIWKHRQEGFGLPAAVLMAEQELLKAKENLSI